MEKNTRERIHTAAMHEFLKKDFQSASLRNIVKSAGVTTGAFYGYYESKEALFEALVSESYNYFMSCYRTAQQTFFELPPQEQPDNMSTISGTCMHELLLYAFDHLNELRLILCHSEGTRFSYMIDQMVEIETKSTHDYLNVLKDLGRPSPVIDEHLEHMLITGMFKTFIEMIIHDMTLEKAEYYLQEMSIFYTAGWMKIMGQ